MPVYREITVLIDAADVDKWRQLMRKVDPVGREDNITIELEESAVRGVTTHYIMHGRFPQKLVGFIKKFQRRIENSATSTLVENDKEQKGYREILSERSLVQKHERTNSVT